MIEYTMLIMLGICIGGLAAFLFAPSVWHRAVRLTTKRLEATMPMSLSEIEADKDLLRASYAVRIRRLEAGLINARDKSANQLVEISKHQMEIAELRRKTALLVTQLEERRNAAAVFESTIRKRLPELEQLVSSANSALDERAADVEDLQRKLLRREETLEQVQRSAMQQQEEVEQLRGVLERQGADKTGRFKRRPSEWGLEDYSSEYDRLNLEMSRMREQLARATDLETRQIAILKREMQQLAERILTSTAAQDTVKHDWREHEAKLHPERPFGQRLAAAPRSQRQAPLVASKPWPGEPKRETPPTAPVLKTEAPLAATTATSNTKPVQPQRTRDMDALAQAPRTSISSLLAGVVQNETKSPVAGPSARSATESPTQDQKAESVSPPTKDGAAKEPERVEAQLDKVFRKMLEGESTSTELEAKTKTEAAATAAAQSVMAGHAMDAPEAESKAESASSSETGGTKTLADRLRMIQDRKTG